MCGETSTLLKLAAAWYNDDHYQQATAALLQVLTRSEGASPQTLHAYRLLINCHMRLGSLDKASEICQEARTNFPTDKGILYSEGLLHHLSGRLPEAKVRYEQVVRDDESPEPAGPADQALRSKALHNLAVVCMVLGQWDSAEAIWHKLRAAVPTYLPAWVGLVRLLISQGRYNEAHRETDAMSSQHRHYADATLLKAELAITCGNLADARRQLEDAVRYVPQDLRTLQALCRFFFEYGPVAELTPCLQELISRQPQDAAVHFNFGTFLLRTGRFSEATEAYERALALRPNSATIARNVAYALEASGRSVEAQAAWTRAAELARERAEPPRLAELVDSS